MTTLYQSVISVKKSDSMDIGTDIDLNLKVEEIYAWENYHSLNKWMKELYINKGGKRDNVNVFLSEDDLMDLNSSFVFKKFIEKALKLVKDYDLFYVSLPK